MIICKTSIRPDDVYRWSVFVVGCCLSLVVVCRWSLFVIGRCLLLVVVCCCLLFVVGHWSLFVVGRWSFFVIGRRLSQGCISCGTCSYPELTEDHVLKSVYVKIFRAVTRNAVNKSV